MIDFGHLQDKQVSFRLISSGKVFSGVVRLVEKGAGLWIESSTLTAELGQDVASKHVIQNLGTKTPIFFVPLSSLMFLIAAKED